MESEIVVKVKYGETLRRFNAPVNRAGQLDFDMNSLREKVLFLFKFSPDADVTLTYIDEDGDVVTLIDEEDLHDAMRQSLNPLRIAVKLNAEKGGKSCTRLSGSCSPAKSPRVQDSILNLSSSVSGNWKSVAVPLQAAVLKLHELCSNTATTVTEIADLLNSVLKIAKSGSLVAAECGTSNGPSGSTMAASVTKKQEASKNLLFGSQVAAECGTSTGPSGSTMAASVTKKQEASKDDEAKSEETPNATFEDPSHGTSQKQDFEKVTSGLKASVTSDSSSLDVFSRFFGNPLNSKGVSPNFVPITSSVAVCDNKKEVKKTEEERHLSAGTGDFGQVNIKPVLSNFHATNYKEFVPSNELGKSVGASASASATAANPIGHSTEDSRNTNSSSKIAGSFSTSMPPECFSAAPLVFATPSKWNYNYGQGTSNVFHVGIICDGCGVHPIAGPRFKSKVKEDYDLCSFCFSKMGHDSDYIRMEHPVTLPNPYPFIHSQSHPSRLPHGGKGGEMNPSQTKLNSCFVADLSVLGGANAIMAPLAPFTKIWRMQNNGSMAWPHGTRLVWVGGHKLTDALSVELQIPSNGLLVGSELDIAVGFTAPELPGWYVSTWRMAAPSGLRFGQHIWVRIQVDAFSKPSLSGMFCGLNLNLPAESSDTEDSEMEVNLNVEPEEAKGNFFEPDSSNKTTDTVELMAHALPDKDRELNLPHNAFAGIGGVSYPVTPKPEALVSFPIINLAAPAPNSHFPPSPTICVPAASQGSTETCDIEHNLLKELVEMGFKKVDLNKEILRMNKYDFEKSLDDLCGVAEWSAILDELQEMGFCDEETNSRLMKKNNGSIKRVVMDLIASRKV